jgi:hypothetical protein
MGRMKDLHITVYAGGDEAVAAVERIGKDWREQLEQAASEIERLRDERRWIPVSERLPEHGDAIWVYGKDVFMGEYWQGTGFQSYGASMDREGLNSETLHGVTHWMEIDEPGPPGVK